MGRLTMNRRFRKLSSLGFIGWVAVFVFANIIVTWSGSQSTAELISKIGVAVLGLAIGLYLMRIPKASRDLLDVHDVLTRMCKTLASEKGAYLARDIPTGLSVYVQKTRRLLVSSYMFAVGQLDDDWEYDPATMQNVNFLTVTFYALSPGVADVRKFTETAAMQGDDLTLMDAPTKRNVLREAFQISRAPRELNFATLDELRDVLAVLNRADPTEETSR